MITIQPTHFQPLQIQENVPAHSDRFKALFQKIFRQIALFYMAVEAFITAIWARTKAVSQLNTKIHNKETNTIQRIYYKQLKSVISKQRLGIHPNQILRKVDQTAKKIEELVKRARLEANVLILETRSEEELKENLEKADELYKRTLEKFHVLSKEPLTQIQKSLYTGRLTTIFRKLDDAFSLLNRRMMHRYCGCHIHSEKSSLEFKQKAPTLARNFARQNYEKFRVNEQELDLPKGKLPFTATLLSQSFGGGHNVVQEAMSYRMARRGGHAYKIEGDIEILENYYNFKKWTGKTGGEWSQYLLQGSHFRLIRFLGWLSSSTERGKIDGLVETFAQSMLERGEQDFAMTLFTRQAKAAEEAALELGQGLLDVATDLDFKIFGFKDGAKNPHFKHMLMARDPELEKEGIPPTLQPHQIVDGGFPVRDPFLKEYKDEEIRAFKDELKAAYGLEEDAKLLVILCGGEGIKNRCAEELFAKYAKDDPKIHIFTVAGNNANLKESLGTLFTKPPHKNVKGSSLGWTPGAMLGKFYALARKEDGLIISAKAGGGTISEVLAQGPQILACDITKMIRHERLNLKFTEKNKAGKTFTRAIELPKRVSEMLKNPIRPTQELETGSIKKSMEIIDKMVDESRMSPLLFKKRKEAFSSFPNALEVVKL